MHETKSWHVDCSFGLLDSQIHLAGGIEILHEAPMLSKHAAQAWKQIVAQEHSLETQGMQYWLDKASADTFYRVQATTATDRVVFNLKLTRLCHQLPVMFAIYMYSWCTKRSIICKVKEASYRRKKHQNNTAFPTAK